MKENQVNHKEQETKYQIAGWILFVICAISFLASSLENRDTLAFTGSVIFLIACIVFLIPLVRTNKKAENDTETHDDKKIT